MTPSQYHEEEEIPDDHRQVHEVPHTPGIVPVLPHFAAIQAEGQGTIARPKVLDHQDMCRISLTSQAEGQDTTACPKELGNQETLHASKRLLRQSVLDFWMQLRLKDINSALRERVSDQGT
jgi:hypothetical protein